MDGYVVRYALDVPEQAGVREDVARGLAVEQNLIGVDSAYSPGEGGALHVEERVGRPCGRLLQERVRRMAEPVCEPCASSPPHGPGAAVPTTATHRGRRDGAVGISPPRDAFRVWEPLRAERVGRSRQ